MKSNNVCTIVTLDYLPYVRTLYDSLARFNAGCVLHVFIADAQRESVDSRCLPPGVVLYDVDELCSGGTGKKVFEKYHASDIHKFRWCMKPVFLEYLFGHAGSEKVIYVDCDMYFFNDYNFLFDYLEHNAVLLTPHWRASDPGVDQKNFFTLYTSGLYNAGFIGANKNALPALRWWVKACLHICERDDSRGQFSDQTHLNLLPIYFDNVKIIKHRGCNVANWNQIECARVRRGDTVLINGKDPIVFIHFTRSTIRGIVKGEDALLAPFFDAYRENLQRHGVCLPINDAGKPPAAVIAPETRSFLRAACDRLRIIRRIKAFIDG
jgi:hypothetical protein